jgi:hypothetical protein
MYREKFEDIKEVFETRKSKNVQTIQRPKEKIYKQ